MCVYNVTFPADLPTVWYVLATENQGTPACICIQIAFGTMAKKLGLELPVITHHVVNMVCNIALIAHNPEDTDICPKMRAARTHNANKTAVIQPFQPPHLQCQL